jgi:hypothetical protein
VQPEVRSKRRNCCNSGYNFFIWDWNSSQLNFWKTGAGASMARCEVPVVYNVKDQADNDLRWSFVSWLENEAILDGFQKEKSPGK